MNSLSQALLILHVVAGCGALILFWIPIFVRKGGSLHRKVGLTYTTLMLLVTLSAIVLSIKNVYQGHMTEALFLGFLGFLTARPLLLGIESLKCKQALSHRYRMLYLVSSIVVATMGAGLIIYGVWANNTTSNLMYVFGTLGLLSLRSAYKLLQHPLKAKYAMWLEDHIENMCISGIAAHTAFIVVGAQSYIASYAQNYPMLNVAIWIAPTVIGIMGIEYFRRRYQRTSAI